MEYYKALTLYFAQALVDIMDHIQDHDIQVDTGYSNEYCAKIAKARKDAIEFLKAESPWLK